MSKNALVLLGHGSKSTEAVEDFNYIVSLVKEKASYDFTAGAHMELVNPSLQEITAELYEQGAREFVILPYFLFNGMHIKEDIPEIIDGLKAKYTDAKFTFGKPFGKQAMLADLILKQANELA